MRLEAHLAYEQAYLGAIWIVTIGYEYTKRASWLCKKLS
jgi:hypothetical protein